MNNKEIASLLLAVVSLIASIATFLLGEDKDNRNIRIIIGVPLLFIGCILGAWGVSGSDGLSYPAPTQIPSVAISSTPTTSPVASLILPTTSTPNSQINIPPTVQPNPVQPNPTLDPSCDSRTGPVREPATQGEQRTYIRCPVGKIQYSIQVDDRLDSIVLTCPNKSLQNITFQKNEERSKGELLQTFDSEIFFSQQGCKINITISNGAEQMGYTIWQESIGSLPSENISDACIESLTNEQGSIEKVCTWWKATAWGGETKEYDPGGCYGIAWNLAGLNNTVVVFKKKTNLTFMEGGWAVQMCPLRNTLVSSEYVGQIQARWNHLAYGGEWGVKVIE